MGCDIHSFAEVRDSKGKWHLSGEVFPLDDWERERYKKEFGLHPFNWRSYSMFGFLAGVRNYSECEPIAEPRGLPEDASPEAKEEAEDSDWHSHSWLTLKELTDFDYDRVFWDRRIMKGGNGAARAEEGEGENVTYREHLSDDFFRDIEVLKTLGAPDDVRVVFWFDN